MLVVSGGPTNTCVFGARARTDFVPQWSSSACETRTISTGPSSLARNGNRRFSLRPLGCSETYGSDSLPTSIAGSSTITTSRYLSRKPAWHVLHILRPGSSR